MAGVTHTKKGFTLSDAAKFKGDNLTLEFTYEMTGEVGYDPKAGYFEKFRAYFAQEAAAKWNKAKVKAESKMKSKFDACDKEFGKYVKDIKKYNILDFSKWQDSGCFVGMFERLLKGLGIYYPGAKE